MSERWRCDPPTGPTVEFVVVVVAAAAAVVAVVIVAVVDIGGGVDWMVKAWAVVVH